MAGKRDRQAPSYPTTGCALTFSRQGRAAASCACRASDGNVRSPGGSSDPRSGGGKGLEPFRSLQQIVGVEQARDDDGKLDSMRL
jgi:hypothetical protein